MVSKGFKQMIAEATAEIETITVAEANALHGKEGIVFVDVREGQERSAGYIPGSIHAPRGFLEFIADPEGPMHHPELASGKRLVLYCGSGARSALAARTLKEMGLGDVCHMAGGYGAWIEANGPTEP